MTIEALSRPVSGVVALSGNPRAGSRTLLVASTVAGRIARAVGAGGEVAELELADVAGELFAASAPAAIDYRSTLAAATIAVVATPSTRRAIPGC